MPYKDKDRQREADRIRQQRRRDAKRAKGVTDEDIMQGVTGFETDAQLEARQQVIARRNADTRARLTTTPLAELKASKTWIPVWRDELPKPATKGQTPGITICQGITKGVLTKEQQVSKQGFNT